MEKTKKGNLLKAVISAMFVAVFCFVLSFCVSTKETKLEAADAGKTSSATSFVVDFKLNDKLTKTLTFAQSTIYGNYTYFVDNEVQLGLAYAVDCTMESDEDDIKAQIDDWNDTIQAIEESIGWKVFAGIFQKSLENVANDLNKQLTSMNNEEQSELVRNNTGKLVYNVVWEMIGLDILGVLLTGLAAYGIIQLIPVIGWIVMAYQVITFIVAIVEIIILVVGAQGLAETLVAGAVIKYNYCINAYEYMTSFDQDSLDEGKNVNFNFVYSDAKAEFSDYKHIATNELVKYEDMWYRKAIYHEVTAYTMRIDVAEMNKRPAPAGFDSWTDYFFPSYTISDSHLEEFNGVRLDAGDRTEALFCARWNETTKKCESASPKHISNAAPDYKIDIVYDKNTPQYKTLHQGIYSFEFKIDMIPVGSKSQSYGTELWTPIQIEASTLEDTEYFYGYGGLYKYGIYAKASEAQARAACADYFKGEGKYKDITDEQGNRTTEVEYIGGFMDEEYKFATKVSHGGVYYYCYVPTNVERDTNFWGNEIRDINWDKAVFSAMIGVLHSDGANAFSTLVKNKVTAYVNTTYDTEMTAAEREAYISHLFGSTSDYYTQTVMYKGVEVNPQHVRILKYVDGYANKDYDMMFSEKEYFNIIIDETNPYQAKISAHDSKGTSLLPDAYSYGMAVEKTNQTEFEVEDAYYSQNPVTLTFNPDFDRYKKYATNNGDALTYYNYVATGDKAWTAPSGVDGMAPGSGVAEYRYAVFRDEAAEHNITNLNRFLFQINRSAYMNYRFCTSISYDEEGAVSLLEDGTGAVNCAYAYEGTRTLSPTADIKYGDTTNWLDIYNNGVNSDYIVSRMHAVDPNMEANILEFGGVAIPYDSWNSVKVQKNDNEDYSAKSEQFTEDGLYFVFVVAVDFVGNVSNAQAIKFMIDSTKPVIELDALKEDLSPIYDASKQIEQLTDANGYVEDGYIITKTTIKTIKFNLYDSGKYGSGIRVGNKEKYKVCVSYLGTSDDDSCLSILNNGSVSNVDANRTEITTEHADDFFDYGFKVYKTRDDMYTITYQLTDGLGDENSGGASSGVFRIAVYLEDDAGNINELNLLFISNIEEWNIKAETETIIDFNFANEEMPIANLNVNLTYPLYRINDKKVLDLDDERVMTQRYMLVGARDRSKFYTNWDQYLAICTENPNDLRCGRKVKQLKDRFINIEPAYDIVELLHNTDDLYENQYLFQHFQIAIPTADTTFYYVIIQEFEFSTDDLIKQLEFVDDQYDKVIGDNLAEGSFNILSTSNHEIRLKYTDYSTFLPETDTLSNFNYMDNFKLSFDLMQLGIEDPLKSSIRIEQEYNLKFKLDTNGNLNKNQSAGDFKWRKDADVNWVYDYVENSVEIDSEGHLIYYFYIDLSTYATEKDIGYTFGINKVKFEATKYNAILGSSPDFTLVPSKEFVPVLGKYTDSELEVWLDPAESTSCNIDTLGGLCQVEDVVGRLIKLVPIYDPSSADKADGTELMSHLNLITHKDVMNHRHFKYYFNNGTKLVNISTKNIKEITDSKGVVTGLKYSQGKLDYDVFVFIPLYIYLEETVITMDTDELSRLFRFNSDVTLVYYDENGAEHDARSLAVHTSCGPDGTPTEDMKYCFILQEKVYPVMIKFESIYVPITSLDLLKAFLVLDKEEGSHERHVEGYDISSQFYINTSGGEEHYSLTNTYNLFTTDKFLAIYTDDEYHGTVNDVEFIPSTGNFKFDSQTMGATPSLYAEEAEIFNNVYWTNSSSLAFEISNSSYYGNAYVFGHTLKYQYGLIPSNDIEIANVIALYAHYNSIDLMDWFVCADPTDLQCVSNVETIKTSIINDYYNVAPDAYKYKIDQYLLLNNVTKSTLNRAKLIELGAYNLEYQNQVAKALINSTKTLFYMLEGAAPAVAVASVDTITLREEKENFIVKKFNAEISKRNDVLAAKDANFNYFYRNYHYDELSGDYKYRLLSELTLDDIYASALALYMNNVSKTSWKEVEYCYESTTSNPCTANTTGVVNATELLGDTSDKEYVLVYRVIDALGRTSLNYKVIHFFSRVQQPAINDVSEIVLTDSSTFYSDATGEATLNLDNLRKYLFGSEEHNIKGYIARWFSEEDTFYKNVVSSKVCIVAEGRDNCTDITNDQVIAMEIGEEYVLQFTLKDKAGNELVFTADFQLIYDIVPTFNITVENAEVFETNKDVKVVVQYRSVAGLDYDRTLKVVTLEDGSMADAANGVFYLDLGEYNYLNNGGVHKNGSIQIGKNIISIYADVNGKDYSDEFIAFLDGMTFTNHVLVDTNGYYFNVAKENRAFILAADMTKPIKSTINEVGRTRIYSQIVAVPNIDITAPVVSFDNQFTDVRDMVDGSYFFNSQSIILHVKDFAGVGISEANINYVSVKPVYDSNVCKHGDVECIAAAVAQMSSVPALNQNIENGIITVDVTPNASRMGLTTYYVAVKDDLGNAAYFRYDIQLDATAPIVDSDTTYISELDENGFVKTSSINIVFNSLKAEVSVENQHEVESPLSKIIISERVINSEETPIETVIECNGKCDTTMTIPYVVRNEKVNLVLTLIDVAGNKSEEFTMTVTIDNMRPELTADVRTNQEVITNQPAKVLIVATDNFSFFEGEFEDEKGIIHYDIEVMKDNSGVWQRINNNYEYTITENGVYTFRANDMAKNFVEKTITITNIDNKAPILTFVPNGGQEAQSHTISMKIEDDLSYLSVIRYCWVTTNSNITSCTESVDGYVSIKASGNETSKEISVTQNTGDANPDGEYVMVVYVSDQWGNEKTYISSPYLLNSKKPSITPNQALVSDGTVAIINDKLTEEVGHTVYESTLTLTDTNNLAHLFTDKAMVTITGESNKEVIGQWVSGFDGEVLPTPVTFDNVTIKDGVNGDYYYLKFTTTYEDSAHQIQTAIVYLVVHVIDRGAPVITLISGSEEIEVNKQGEDYVIPGVSITDTNDGTLNENTTLRTAYFFKYGEYVPSIEELEADMALTTHTYIPYASNQTISIKEIGTYLIYYVATDSSGNSASTLRTIKIIDETAPVIKFTNPLVVEHFIYVRDEEKSFNVYDYESVTDNYNDMMIEDIKVVYEYRTDAGTFNTLEYREGQLATLGYHRFTYTVSDQSGNETVIVRTIHTVNVEIKYINGELAGRDVSLAENDSFIIKGGVRIKENNLKVLINDMPINEVAVPVNLAGEIYYEYSANGKQNIKVIDEIGNEVTYALYMVKIDQHNPEEQEELKVLIDKNLIASTKQIVASSSDFVENVNSDGEAVSYTIFLNDYNININGEDSTTTIDGQEVQNSIILALFCDNVVDNNGVKCSSNYLELTLEGKMLDTSSTITITPALNAITLSKAEYENMLANGNKIVMLVVTEDDAKKVETYVTEEPKEKLSDSSVSTMVLFGVPSVIGLVAILRVLKFKKSVKTV